MAEVDKFRSVSDAIELYTAAQRGVILRGPHTHAIAHTPVGAPQCTRWDR